MAGLLDDTTVSAIGYLNAIKAIVNEDADTALRYNAEAKAAFEQSKTHELWYLDHYEKQKSEYSILFRLLKRWQNM